MNIMYLSRRIIVTLLVEHVLDELHKLGCKIISDFDVGSERIIQLRKHTLYITLKYEEIISFDVYSYLSSGIYELGELQSLTRKMLEIKKIILAFNSREMNTTERLYPKDRQGSDTQTSGL